MSPKKFSIFLTTSFLFFSTFELYNNRLAFSQDFNNPIPVERDFNNPIPVETETISPTEQQLTELRDRKRILEAEYDLLRQQVELTKLKGTAVAPTTDATRPLESSETETEEGTFQTVESRILAYEAMNKVAGAIYKDIGDVEDIDSIVVYDKEIFSTLTAYRLLKVKIKEFQRRYADLQITVSPTRTRGGTRGITDFTPLGLPTTFTRSVLEFVALFRSRDKITFEPDFELNPNSLVSAIASHFQKNDIPIKVYNPGFYLMSLDSFKNASLENIVGKDFSDLIDLRSKASSVYAGQSLATLNEEVDIFLESLLVPVDKSDPYGNPPLLSIIQANQLDKILNDNRSYVLNLDIDVSGGSHRTRSSLFTTIFSGSRISYSGGAVINYSLFARDGAMKKSGFFYYNTGYRGMKGKRTNID